MLLIEKRPSEMGRLGDDGQLLVGRTSSGDAVMGPGVASPDAALLLPVPLGGPEKM